VAVAAHRAALRAARDRARAEAEAAAALARAALDAAGLGDGAAALLRVLDRLAPTAGKALRVAHPAPGAPGWDERGDGTPGTPGTLACLAASGTATRLLGRRFTPHAPAEPAPGEQAATVSLAARGRVIGDLWVATDAAGGGLSAHAAHERLAALAAPLAAAVHLLLLQDGARRRRRDELAPDEELRQAEKMAALGELVAGVAHEINNPLTGISAFAELLLDEPLTPEQREGARLIKREADRAVAIVRDLLVFSRDADPAWFPVDVNAVVERVLRMRAYALREAGVAVHVELDPALPRVRGDEARLQQAVLNIVLNAEHALRDVAERRLAVRSARAAGDRVVVTVTDSGPGMAPETLARVFEPFFTTKPPGEGTGLGLSVGYGIVQALGGEIVARSAPGAGAAFEVVLPADLPPPDDVVASS
jgi:signal transduction histidine kinase